MGARVRKLASPGHAEKARQGTAKSGVQTPRNSYRSFYPVVTGLIWKKLVLVKCLIHNNMQNEFLKRKTEGTEGE